MKHVNAKSLEKSAAWQTSNLIFQKYFHFLSVSRKGLKKMPFETFTQLIYLTFRNNNENNEVLMI